MQSWPVLPNMWWSLVFVLWFMCVFVLLLQDAGLFLWSIAKAMSINIYIYWLLYIYILYDIIDWLIIDNYVYTYNYIFEHAFSFTWVFSPQHFLFHSCPRIGCSWGVHRSTWAALVLIGYLRLSGRRVTCQLATLNVWRPDTVQDWLEWGNLPWRESEGTQK